MSLVGRMRRVFLPVLEALPMSLAWRISAIRAPTDEEVIAEVEERLLHGPLPSPMSEDMTKMFELLDKTPLRPQVLWMSQQEYDDILRWGKEQDTGR